MAVCRPRHPCWIRCRASGGAVSQRCIALGAIHELQRRGLRVPADVQLIGFDNVPESEYSVPALTAIDPHADDYAKHAVDMLIERIEGYSGPPHVHHRFTVVERASTKLAR